MPPARETLAGIGLIVIVTVLTATQDLISKELTQSLPVSQILAVRFAAMMAFAIAYVLYRSRVKAASSLLTAIRSASPWVQTVRCLLCCAEIALFTFALRYLGLAQIHAVFACFPLIVTALSMPVLGEMVGWRRWLAVGCGFIGTLIILRPGTAVFEPAALLGLGCAVLYALYNLMTRKVSRTDSFETSILFLALIGFVTSASVAVLDWQTVPPEHYWLLVGVCLTSIATHLLLIKALSLAAAVVLQPFNYLILVWAIAMGYLVYGEQLDRFQVSGALLVVISGVYIGWREYRLTRV